MKIKITESQLNKIIKSSIEKCLKENINNNIEEEVVDYIMNKWSDEIDGSTTISEICNIIDDAYIEVCGEELNDNYIRRNIIRMLQKRIFN